MSSDNPRFDAVVITRPEPAASEFALALRQKIKTPILVAPLRQTQSLNTPLPSLAEYDALIFSSANIFRFIDADLSGLAGFCIGNQTAEIFQNHGGNLKEVFVDARALIAHLEKEVSGRLLALTGKPASRDFTSLQNDKLHIEQIALYEATDCEWDDELQSRIAALKSPLFPVFSKASWPKLEQVIMEAGKAQSLGILPHSKAIEACILQSDYSKKLVSFLLEPPKTPNRHNIIEKIAAYCH